MTPPLAATLFEKVDFVKLDLQREPEQLITPPSIAEFESKVELLSLKGLFSSLNTPPYCPVAQLL